MKRAVVELVQRLDRKRRGKKRSIVPRDLNDFLRQSELLVLDRDGNPVDFDRVLVVWTGR